MINIVPINDIKKHREDMFCDCKPEIVLKNNELIIIHNSYDGREIREALIDQGIKSTN